MRCYQHDNVVFVERHLNDGLILQAIKDWAIEYLGLSESCFSIKVLTLTPTMRITLPDVEQATIVEEWIRRHFA